METLEQMESILQTEKVLTKARLFELYTLIDNQRGGMMSIDPSGLKGYQVSQVIVDFFRNGDNIVKYPITYTRLMYIKSLGYV